MKWQDIVEAAVACHATDIHLQEGRVPLLRRAGELVPHGTVCMSRDVLTQWVAELSLSAAVVAGAAAFSWRHVRCRLQISKEYVGIHLVIRILYPLDTLPPDPDSDLLQQLGACRDGLVLLCGPTGSGKTTTLWRILQYVNDHRRCHIITLEDPIEYVVEGKLSLISQRELHVHVDSFSAGIKEALRQDPDILLIGEMRDRETMDAAITAAETGHLVFSTLHTRSAFQAVQRLAGAYGGAEQEELRCRLAMVLQGILAQQCCYHDGQIHILREILLHTPAVAQLIRSSKEHQLGTVMQTNGAMGMRTMEQARQQYRRHDEAVYHTIST